MATYSSPDYINNAPVAVHGERGGVQCARFTIASTGILGTADVLNFGYVPAGARLVGGYAVPSDLSAGADITISIGDAGSATRIFNASTMGQAGTPTLIPVAALDYKWTAKTLIVGSMGVAATTTASGTITLVLLYVVED